jgi:hypothetical protein
MENFGKIINEIELQLSVAANNYEGDISDIGNEIGIIIANHLDKDNTIEDFIHGVRHGVSLADGTHP